MNDYNRLYDAVAKTAQGDVPVRYLKESFLREGRYVLLKDNRIAYLDTLWPDRIHPETCLVIVEDADGRETDESIPVDEVKGVLSDYYWLNQ